jgi:hypothetical protein
LVGQAAEERVLPLARLGRQPTSFRANVGASGRFTWWMPPGADAWVLPISAGVIVDTSQKMQMNWLRRGSPWSLAQLPAFGARYGNRMEVVIVPWPQYAELVVTDRIGVRFSFPTGRRNVAPCELVAVRRGPDPLEVARAFRQWRHTARDTGSIPRPRPLAEKTQQLPAVARLYGAPHIYLWGPALFSRHDVERSKWLSFARALRDAPADSLAGRMVARFTAHQRKALLELAQAEQPLPYLTVQVAAALDRLMADPALLSLPAKTPRAEVAKRNRSAIAAAFPELVHDPKTWGDGASLPILDALHDAGIDRALLLLCDLYGRSLRPDVVARARELGYLLGPYDSYHSVHPPDADPDQTWETAQFDRAAYERGRVRNADGTGHRGFRGVGYHFSPIAAWPYVQKRVGGILNQARYSAWFIDCDATAECFDDYTPGRDVSRVDDIKARRRRLRWLETERRLVVGSEEGSALLADTVHFGHGVHTPYIGHLDPAFRDRNSPHFLGRHWPPDTPESSFKAVPVPPALVAPYFSPQMRIPLYQAALGDELITTHHWSFDSLKFHDIANTRELMEILYNVPPMYHLNRESWPKRRERIVRHTAFWAPIHRRLAEAPLTRFAWLSEDRLLQRATFRTARGDVTITVNFGKELRRSYPGYSATVAGPIDLGQRVYVLQGR